MKLSEDYYDAVIETLLTVHWRHIDYRFTALKRCAYTAATACPSWAILCLSLKASIFQAQKHPGVATPWLSLGPSSKCARDKVL